MLRTIASRTPDKTPSLQTAKPRFRRKNSRLITGSIRLNLSLLSVTLPKSEPRIVGQFLVVLLIGSSAIRHSERPRVG
jgi:hypothetical protein